MSDAAARPPPPRFSIARRPAVLVAALFMVGIFLHGFIPPWTIAWLAAVAGLLALAWRTADAPRIASLLIMLACLGAGVVAGQVEAFHYPANHVSAFAGEESRLAQLELRIEDPPRVLSNPFDQRRGIAPKQAVTAEVTRILTWQGWEDACGEILRPR
jgi:hypothetical protein